MQKLTRIVDSRNLDRQAQQLDAVTDEVLMESAGSQSALLIHQKYAVMDVLRGYDPQKVYQQTHRHRKRLRIGIVCGPGNNGADGLVCARHLLSFGHQVEIFLSSACQDEKKQSRLFRLQWQRWLRMHKQQEPVEQLTSLFAYVFGNQPDDKINKAILNCDVLIDALWGTGFVAKPKVLSSPEAFFETDNKINSPHISPLIAMLRYRRERPNAPLVSLDIPSGLDADRGVVSHADLPAVQATLTLTFGCAKPGFYLQDGPSHVGEVQVLPIGFSPQRLLQAGRQGGGVLWSQDACARVLPRRSPTSHKATHGQLILAAGSRGMWGAGVMAARAAYRMGAGYVLWSSLHMDMNKRGEEEGFDFGFDFDSTPVLKIPEALFQPGALSKDEFFQQQKLKQKKDDKKLAWAIGPGLGVGEKTLELIDKVQALGYQRVILDADALSSLALRLFPAGEKPKRQHIKLPSSWILTPHAAELSRLLNMNDSRMSVEEIERDRLEAVRRATEAWGCIVLLKGLHSVVGFQSPRLGFRYIIIPTGNAALAKAGTGDVLTGMIGGLLAQGVRPLWATAAAAYRHGQIADHWVEEKKNQMRSLTASDILDSLV